MTNKKFALKKLCSDLIIKMPFEYFWNTKFPDIRNSNQNSHSKIPEMTKILARLKVPETQSHNLPKRKQKAECPEAVAQRYSVKKMFLEISQNSQESTYARVSYLIKLQVSGLIPASTPFLTEHLRLLLLNALSIITSCMD